MRTRNNRVWVRLADKEFNRFKENVKRSGLSREAYMRILITGYVPKEKPDDRFYIVMRQLIGIGNNLHQLVKKANAIGFIDVPMLKTESEKWDKFHEEINHRYLYPEKMNTWNINKQGVFRNEE